MKEDGLSNSEWRMIAPLLPDKPRGIPRVDDRRVISGILWVLRNGRTWRELPAHFGPRTTCYNRYVRWRASGVWQHLMSAIEDSPRSRLLASEIKLQPNGSRSEDTRTRILRIALRLFALGGFDGVSTRHIAAAAAVPPASLRYYFKSKLGLYEACLAYIHELAFRLIDAPLSAAQRLCQDTSADPGRLIEAYCDMQDSYVDVLIGSDDGMLALFVVRNDLPTERGLAPAHTDDPLGARVFECHIGLIRRLSGNTLTVNDATLVWIMLHGQLITVCMSRPQLEARAGEFTSDRVDRIKQLVRRQTSATLREYATDQ